MTAIDDPTRFRCSHDVAAYFGLTSRRAAVEQLDRRSGISRACAPNIRRALYGAASVLMTRFKGKNKVKSWGQMIAKRSCRGKATVAVARKLAVIMHAMWTDGTFYVGDPNSRTGEVRGARRRQAAQAPGVHA